MPQVTVATPNLEISPNSLEYERTVFVDSEHTPKSSVEHRLPTPNNGESPFSLAGYSGSDFDTYLHTSIVDAINAPYGTDHGEYVARLNGLDAGHRYRQEFGIRNIKEHMGVWTAPSEEINASLLDAKYNRLLAVNAADALHFSSLASSEPGQETDTNLLVADFRESSAMFAAYTYVKMLAIDRHLKREQQTDATIDEEFGINEETVAKTLGLSPEEFATLCIEQRHIVGDHLFITPLHDYELYADMLRREKLFQVHRMAEIAGRVLTLDDELAEQFATNQAAAHMQTPQGLDMLLTAQETVADAAKAEVDELSGLLSPSDAPENRRAKLHAARTQKEIQLRVERFKFENDYHTRVARLGVEAVTKAETTMRNRDKRAKLDFAVNSVLEDLPNMSEEAVKELRASIHEGPLTEQDRGHWIDNEGVEHWEDDLSLDRRSREKVNRGIDHQGNDVTNGALIFLEGKIEERLGHIELAKHLCAAAFGLVAKGFTAPKTREVDTRYKYDMWRSQVVPSNKIYSPEAIFLKTSSPAQRATEPETAAA